MEALVTKTLIAMNPLRDCAGNIVDEFPQVYITDLFTPKQHPGVTWLVGIRLLDGARFYYAIEDVLAF